VYGASHVLLLHPRDRVYLANYSAYLADPSHAASASLLQHLQQPQNATSGHALIPQPTLLLMDARSALSRASCIARDSHAESEEWGAVQGACAASSGDSRLPDEALLQQSSNTTAYIRAAYPIAGMTVRIKPGSGSRNGYLAGSRAAVYGPMGGFVFTDLAVVGPYEGYVLVFEYVGLPWPVVPAESAPFRVDVAT
jgi:hypothetical protein